MKSVLLATCLVAAAAASGVSCSSNDGDGGRSDSSLDDGGGNRGDGSLNDGGGNRGDGSLNDGSGGDSDGGGPTIWSCTCSAMCDGTTTSMGRAICASANEVSRAVSDGVTACEDALTGLCVDVSCACQCTPTATACSTI
jgi:hypothetical protein